MAKRKVKQKFVTVSIAMKVNVAVPDYKLGKQTTKTFAEKLARKMLAQAGGELRKVNGGFAWACDWKTAETDTGLTFSDKDMVYAPAV